MNNTNNPSSRFVAINPQTQEIFTNMKNTHARALNGAIRGNYADPYLKLVLNTGYKAPGYIYHGVQGPTLLVPKHAIKAIAPPDKYVRPRLYSYGGGQAGMVGGNLPSNVVDAVVRKAMRNNGKIGVAKKIMGRSGGATNGYAFFALNEFPDIQMKISVENLKGGKNLPRVPTNDEFYYYRKGSVKEGTELFLKKQVN